MSGVSLAGKCCTFHVRAQSYRATGLAVDRITGLAGYYYDYNIRYPARLSHARAHTYQATGLAVDRISGLAGYHYNCYIRYPARLYRVRAHAYRAIDQII